MGMSLLHNRWNDIPQNTISYSVIKLTEKKMQMYKLTVIQSTYEMSVIFVYINKTPTLSEVKEIGNVLKDENANFILGDFNIDRNKEDGIQKINELSKKLKMRQVNNESTRNSAVLDLIFIENKGKETDVMEFKFENLYSDHSTIGFRYCRNGIVDESFKELKITEQDKDFLKKTTIDEGKQIAEDEISNWKPRKISEDEKVTKNGSGKNQVRKQRQIARNLNIQNEEYDPIVFTCRVDEVRSSSIRKLLHDEWIDSAVINCYLYMVASEFPQVLAIDTQFNNSFRNKTFRLIDRQFGRENNIFDYSVWIIPINCDNLHWFLMTVDCSQINEKKIHINIFDSMGGNKMWTKVIEEKKFKRFIQWKYNKTYQTNESVLSFTIVDYHDIIPQQSADNGVDCGIFTIMYAKYTAAHKTFTFSQNDMQRFRKMISEEIMKGELQQIERHNETDPEVLENLLTWNLKNVNAQSEDIFKKPLRPKDAGSQERKQNLTKNKLTRKYVSRNIDLDESTPSTKRQKILPTAGTSSGIERSVNLEEQPKRGSREVIIIEDEDGQINTNIRSEPVRQQRNADVGNLKVLKFVNPTGKNLCFSNAIMTLLMNIKGIRDVINGTTHLLFENSILKALRRVYQKPNFTVTSTQNLRRVVEEECLASNQMRIFNNNAQCDAAEFLNSLLEHLLKDDPHVSRNLFGQTMETIYCKNKNCNAADNRPSSDVVILTLRLVSPTLSMCLDNYLGLDEIERNCPHCGCKQATQATNFSQDPEILLIQLKRFDNQGNKISRDVSVPSELNLPSGTLYKIVGSCQHSGQTVHSGHYVATLYDKDTERLFLINDDQHTEVPGMSPSCHPSALSSTIYVIVYEKQ